MSKHDCMSNPDVPRFHEEKCPDCGEIVEVWSNEDETRCKCGRAFSYKQIKKQTPS
ncbi:MAG: hypothetical protein NOU37_08865 [Candidatus Brocadiales bacterium]|nr:hypothetical protein [Candidatus Bathyanammoxibius sp.]MCQ4575342.1 hypothetical protein [Candidatus Bathyanammoxibius amoris]